MTVPEPARVAAAIDLLVTEHGALAQVAAYRLLRAELARQRGLAVAAGPVLDGARAEQASGLLVTHGPAGDDVRDLAELHQRLLPPRLRKAAGAWYTPQPLIDHLLDETLEPALDEADADVTVLDPACGSGLFLVAALQRFVRRGVPADVALRRCLRGIELDPAAAELTRLSLWIAALDGGSDPDLPDAQVAVGDALDLAEPEAYDVVVGNPPFLNRLERRTALDPAVGRRLAAESRGALRPYTDLSAVFLHHSVSWLRPGGRVGLVQPQSLLAARDAAGVRRHLAGACSLEVLWASSTPVFDAGVLTCAPVLRKGAAQGRVRRRHGPLFESWPCADPGDLDETWSHLVADILGVPSVWTSSSRPTGRLGDVCDCSADFRDQYYGLDGHVHEARRRPEGVPLVTVGLVDPALNRWGEQPTRFLKKRWAAPVVDVDSLTGTPLHRWARARLVPKILVATQGKVIEAVVDEDGSWLPSVPVVTATPHEDVSLWHLLAVLLAPPVAAHAAATYAGAGFTMRSVKLSARQVADLPLPTEHTAWDQAADYARKAQHDADHRVAHLEEMGRLMCRAYEVASDDVLPWWRDRLR